MVKIFAKHGTTEKALVVCSSHQVGVIITALGAKYGGDWIWVDKINPTGEILHFDDGLRYFGFHGRDERYCKAIEQL
jgi:hypothetical protein